MSPKTARGWRPPLGVEPERFLTAYQIHSPQVVVAETPWPRDARPRADGIVTRMPGLAIGVSTADCGPVLLADPQARVIGAAHAGWRGALFGVVEATIAAMERLGAARERIHAALGPMIRQPNYEVGPDLIDRFATEDRRATFSSPRRRAKAMPSSTSAATSPRGCGGPASAQIEDVGLCTYAEPALFLQLPARDAPRRRRLRPSRQRHRAPTIARE